MVDHPARDDVCAGLAPAVLVGDRCTPPGEGARPIGGNDEVLRECTAVSGILFVDVRPYDDRFSNDGRRCDMADAGDRAGAGAGEAKLRGLGAVGGRLSVKGNAPISPEGVVDVSPAFAAADNLDFRKSRADARGEAPMAEARCSFLFFCKISKAAFNSFAPPVRFFLLSVRGESCRRGFELDRGRRLPRSSSSSSGCGALRYGDTGELAELLDPLELRVLTASSELSYVKTCRVAGGLRAPLLLEPLADLDGGRRSPLGLSVLVVADPELLVVAGCCCCCCFCRCWRYRS